MQMMLNLSGFGLGINGVNVSANKAAVLVFRDAPDEGSVIIGIDDGFELGASGPNGILSAVRTEWFPLNVSENKWLFNPLDLVGRQGKIEVPGSSFISDDAFVDFKFEVFDQYHKVEHSIHLRHIPVLGGSYQLGGFSVEGEIKSGDPAKGVADPSITNEDGRASVS